MIVRYSITCETCSQPHTVRIGMGQEEYQTHHFPCRSCGEDIVIGLEVDYENVSFKALCVSNAKQAEEVDDAPIVNVDANFLIPSEEQGQDRSFPRLKQMHEMAEEARKKGFPPPSRYIFTF